jgi:uncharacterized protein YfcZ (UPF0381/DUF406 family)
MQEENELDNSQSVEEVAEEVAEVIDPEDEIVTKNRELYERAKRAEAKLKELETKLTETVSDPYDDDDEVKAKVQALEAKLQSIEERSQFDTLYTQYPILKEKKAEFDEYREANPGMSMQTSAKAYLIEHDLIGQEPKRKGLEKAGGGQRTPPTGKMAVEDAKRLRENNYSEYKKLLMAGKIQF